MTFESYFYFSRYLESDFYLAFYLFRNPGGTPDWLGNVILAVFVAAVVCLTLVYLLSYIHLSGFCSPQSSWLFTVQLT